MQQSSTKTEEFFFLSKNKNAKPTDNLYVRNQTQKYTCHFDFKCFSLGLLLLLLQFGYDAGSSRAFANVGFFQVFGYIRCSRFILNVRCSSCYYWF